ncbi:MAG: hypothetical protein AABW46_02550 [Nanoarchaeota archaeon]
MINNYNPCVSFYYGSLHSAQAEDLILKIRERGIKVLAVSHDKNLFEFTLVSDNGTYSGLENVNTHI